MAERINPTTLVPALPKMDRRGNKHYGTQAAAPAPVSAEAQISHCYDVDSCQQDTMIRIEQPSALHRLLQQ